MKSRESTLVTLSATNQVEGSHEREGSTRLHATAYGVGEGVRV